MSQKNLVGKLENAEDNVTAALREAGLAGELWNICRNHAAIMRYHLSG